MPFTPREILQQVPIAQRLRRLEAMRQIYNQNILPHWPNTLLNVDVLLHGIESYFCDLCRTKAFHDIRFADQHKRAALTLKWVAKTKPIQLTIESPVKKSDMLANEIYALHCGLFHLNADINRLSQPLRLNLLYMLHNRNLDGEVLSTLMYAIECGLNQKFP